MNYQYTYLIWTITFGIIWSIFYIRRKDTRREMLLMSGMFGIGGVLSELTHISDWWQPLTITGTRIGLEDFLIGFFIGGIASVIYEEIYKKRIRTRKKNNILSSKTRSVFILFLILFFGSFYILNINSAYSCLIAFIISTILMLVKRKDLIIDSLFSGGLMLILGGIIYIIMQVMQPGFIQEFWYLNTGSWYEILFLGVPLGEYIWFFLAGAFIGPLYEYWQEGKLIKIK